MFNFELDRIVAWITDGGYTSVALQLPEGLKIRATEISDYLTERTGADIMVIGFPCYGACDLFDYHGLTDALVHFGHSPIPSQGDDPNVLYIESRSDAVIDPSVMDSLGMLPERVGLLATVQYLDLIPVMRDMLESSGRTVLVGRGDSRICYPGQVLGCNCSAAEDVIDDVDAFLFLGEGDFHTYWPNADGLPGHEHSFAAFETIALLNHFTLEAFSMPLFTAAWVLLLVLFSVCLERPLWHLSRRAVSRGPPCPVVSF